MVHLQVRPDGSGGWGLWLGVLGEAAGSGTVRAETVQTLETACQRALRPTPGLAIRGRDAACSRAERALGVQLHAALREAGLDTALARCLGGGESVAVLCELEAGANLPWELLADERGDGLEESGQAVVVRLARSNRPWQPSEATGGQVVHALDTDATSTGLATALAPLAQQGRAMVHVVVHGHRLHTDRLTLGDTGAAPDTWTHALGADIRAAAVVVLDVCHGGSTDLERDLAAAAVSAGARAVVAPLGPASVDTLEAFARGLTDGLTGGAPLWQAVAGGRTAIRALASPRPDGRWHRLTLTVGRAEALTWCASAPPTDLLTRLRAETPHGYLGVDTVARLLPAEEVGWVPPPADVQVRTDRPATVTPRLETILGGSGDVVAETVRAALARWQPDGPGPLDPGGTTLELDPTLPRGVPARALEVVGGPEDGRKVVLSRGQTLGRWSERGGPDVGLFEATGAWDAYLSRTHLRWLGEGWVELLRPGRTTSGQVVRGPVALVVGQVVWLTPTTGVRGV